MEYQDKKDKIFKLIKKACEKSYNPLYLGIFKNFSYIKNKEEFEKEINQSKLDSDFNEDSSCKLMDLKHKLMNLN